MNIGRILTTVILTIATLCANAQTTKPQTIIVIDGHFFNEMPVSKSNISKMHMLQTPNGTMALGLELSTELSEEALKHALPKVQIPEADILLQKYNEAKGANSSISLTVAKKATLNVGDKFPAFSAMDIDGKRWNQEDVKGKVMVLNLWYSGCAPCRAEMPELSTWKSEMPDVMYFSATYESAEVARPIIEKQGFNWTHLVENTQFKEFIGSNGYPMIIIVDKAGVVSMIEHGTSPTQRAELKKKIEELRK
ncbi:MAG: TlpA family protein disulfide reductase [Paludibacteraceae bacterium]|nr:TlpA family protein disulfide reductase [Paludibacteraceae bacterium]